MGRDPWPVVKGFPMSTFEAGFVDEGHCQIGLRKVVLKLILSINPHS